MSSGPWQLAHQSSRSSFSSSGAGRAAMRYCRRLRQAAALAESSTNITGVAGVKLAEVCARIAEQHRADAYFDDMSRSALRNWVSLSSVLP